MLQFLTFAIIFGIMMYIWSFVFLNKNNDKLHNAFLSLISFVMLWMVLSMCNTYNSTSVFGLILKTVYWLCMMSLSMFFLFFVYRLIRKKLDAAFYIFAGINTITIIMRYFYPIDYSDPTFWRLSLPVVAPIMSASFTLPAAYALILLIRRYLLTRDPQQKAQIQYIFLGVFLSVSISVISEYVLPAVFHIHLGISLMYIAILIFIVCMFVSIMRYKLMNMRSEYIYRRLLSDSPEGVLLVNRHRKIIYANNAVKRILHSYGITDGNLVADYIPGYSFEENYVEHEVSVDTSGGVIQISLTQYPTDPGYSDSAKILKITDVTLAKREKELLAKKAITDPLTGFYTKQYLNERCLDCAGASLSVLFIDIDNLKSVNDRYGHMAGDKILEAVAVYIRNNVRGDTKIIRFGGDEFVILLEGTSADDACRIAERICRGVADMDLDHYNLSQKVSLSIGVANNLMLGICSVSELIKKADTAMYKSKSVGKNNVTLFTETDNDNLKEMLCI
mgnify:CR=1 FL=1